MEFPPDNQHCSYLLSVGQPGSRQPAPSLVDILGSVTPISSDKAIFCTKSGTTRSPLNQLLRLNGSCLVPLINFLMLRNATALSQRPPLSWMLGICPGCYCADWLRSSCGHRIPRSSGQSARLCQLRLCLLHIYTATYSL